MDVNKSLEETSLARFHRIIQSNSYVVIIQREKHKTEPTLNTVKEAKNQVKP